MAQVPLSRSKIDVLARQLFTLAVCFKIFSAESVFARVPRDVRLLIRGWVIKDIVDGEL